MPSDIEITRRLHFSAGHRLLNHEGGCSHLHGHNYFAFITCKTAAELDSVGRVIDFAVVKQRVGGWLDEKWDHGYILNSDDRAGREAMKAFDTFGGPSGLLTDTEQKLFLLPNMNPTAENMASFLLRSVCPKVLHNTGVVTTAVRLEETENCFAVATLY